MTQYAEVAVNVPQVGENFDYRVPADLQGQVRVGSLVVVPFGAQSVQGIVTRLLDTPRVAVTRPISLLVDPQPVVTSRQLDLAAWMAHETLSPLAACLDLMLPPGLSQQADSLYEINPGSEVDPNSLSRTQQRIWSMLSEKGPLRGRQFEAAFRHANWRSAMQAMARRGWILSRPVLQTPDLRPKTVRTVRLACSPEDARAHWNEVGRAGSAAQTRRQKMLEHLIQESGEVDVSWVYAASGGNLADLEKLAEMGLVALGETETWRDPLETMEQIDFRPPVLTADQQNVWESVESALQTTAPQLPHVLFGVTGSGKTEIYLRAVAETLRQGKQAIVLVPEISLTPQTVQRFQARFPGQVGLVHSRLSSGERYDTWRRARTGQLSVIVGPRSALFSPLPDLGLIVVDEFHEESYAQSDSDPRYHAVRAAVEYARLTGSLLLLGSATPEISLLYQASRQKWPILRLPERIMARRPAIQAAVTPSEPHVLSAPVLPPVSVVDMRKELASGNRSIFSRELQESLERVLANKQQAILFLNRRGSATYVFCRACGESLCCPRCELPLTYHTGGSALICHTCNYRRNLPRTCPKCGSDQIRQYGAGTEKVEAMVREQYPDARVLRWDAETTRQKGAHETLLGQFTRHQADILIGTQMVAKGLDLPLVTLVGVVLADVGINLPDFRAGERTFQLLTQVAGRAGRSALGGKAIFQTFQPDHYVIRAAAQHDYRAFYQQEIARRKDISYPPFARLVRMEIRNTSAVDAEKQARAMADNLRIWLDEAGQHNTFLVGPAPCFFARQNNQFRWHIILRGVDPSAALRGRSLGEWRVEVDPPSLL